jgi:exodeoxyribonuclease VIII
MDYYKINALSNSSLSVLKKSPQEFYQRFVTGEDKSEETDAMRLGSAVHMLALEPERFDAEYVVLDGPINPRTQEPFGRETKAFDTWRKEAEANETRKIIIRDDFANAIAIAQSFHSHEIIQGLMSVDGKEFEKSLLLTYQFSDGTSEQVKCKPDCIIPAESIIVDLKTSSDPRPEEFQWSALRYGYYRQAAIYLDACEVFWGREFRFLFGVVNSKKPHECGVFELTPGDIQRGRDEYHELIEEYSRRKISNNWRSDWQIGIHSLSLPRKKS